MQRKRIHVQYDSNEEEEEEEEADNDTTNGYIFPTSKKYRKNEVEQYYDELIATSDPASHIDDKDENLEADTDDSEGEDEGMVDGEYTFADAVLRTQERSIRAEISEMIDPDSKQTAKYKKKASVKKENHYETDADIYDELYGQEEDTSSILTDSKTAQIANILKEKVHPDDLMLAQKESESVWGKIRPPLDPIYETNQLPFTFECSSMDYAIDPTIGLNVRMSGVTTEGHGCMVRIKGFYPYLHVRKPQKWTNADVTSFIQQLSKRLLNRMEGKYNVYKNPDYFKKMDQQRVAQYGGGGNSGRFYGAHLVGNQNSMQNDLAELEAEERSEMEELEQKPARFRPKWIDFYEYVANNKQPLIRTPAPDAFKPQWMEKGYSAYHYEDEKSDFIKIELAYPSLVLEVRTLLDNVTGKVDLTPKEPGMKKFPVKPFLSKDLLDKLDECKNIEVFNANIEFCRRFTLDTGTTPERWLRIPAKQYQVIPKNNLSQCSEEDKILAFYTRHLQSSHKTNELPIRDSNVQLEIVANYKDIKPIITDPSQNADPNDIKLHECHSRKIVCFGDIETKVNEETGSFPNAKTEPTIMTVFSVYVDTPRFMYNNQDYSVRSSIDKSKAKGAERVLEDFVFVVGTCAKPPKGKFKNKVHIYNFKSEAGKLLAVQRFLVTCDVDDLVFYNSSFDEPYLVERSIVLGVGIPFSYLGKLNRTASKVQESTFSSSAHGQLDSKCVPISMRMQKDPLVIFQKMFKFRSYTLGYVSKQLLGDDKLEIDIKKLNELSTSSRGMLKIFEYCRKDVHLLGRLVFKEELLPYFTEMAAMTYIEVDKLLTRGEQIRIMSLLYEEAFNNRPDKFFFPLPAEGRTYPGAIVQDAATGLYRSMPDNENQSMEDMPTLPPKCTELDLKECYTDSTGEALVKGGGLFPLWEPHDLGLSNEILATMENDTVEKVIDTTAKEMEGSHLTLDFAAMYPTIMIAENYGADTLIPRERVEILARKKGWKHGVDYHTVKNMVYHDKVNHMYITYLKDAPIFVDKKHRIPLMVSVIQILLNARGIYKIKMNSFVEGSHGYKNNNTKQLLTKIIANSCYGITGVIRGQFPCTEVADSVTRTGRAMITKTKAACRMRYTKKNGYPCDAVVTYGDTDSIFVFLPGIRILHALIFGKLMSEEMTSIHPRPHKLELEKGYAPLILYKKKRYGGKKYILGMRFKTNENGEFILDPVTKKQIFEQFILGPQNKKGDIAVVHTSGMETKRRDWCPLVGKLMNKCLDLILKQNKLPEAIEVVKRNISKIMTNQIGIDKLILNRKLNKPIYEYKKPDPNAPKSHKASKIAARAKADKEAKVAMEAAAGGGGNSTKAGTRKKPKNKILNISNQKTNVKNFFTTIQTSPGDVPPTLPIRHDVALNNNNNNNNATTNTSSITKKSAVQSDISSMFKLNGTKKLIALDPVLALAAAKGPPKNGGQKRESSWTPPMHVAVAIKRHKRDPNDCPSSGERINFVVTAEYDGKSKDKTTAACCDDPEYVLRNGIGISMEYYLNKQLKPPLVRFFEPIFTTHTPEQEFFSLGSKETGIDTSHIQTLVKPSTKLQEIWGSFAKGKNCVSCGNAITTTNTRKRKRITRSIESLGSMLSSSTSSCDVSEIQEYEEYQHIEPICSDCSEQDFKIGFERTLHKSNILKTRFANLWAVCQKCTGCSEANQMIECNNKECGTFWQSKKLDVDIQQNHEILQRFVDSDKIPQDHMFAKRHCSSNHSELEW